MQPVGSLVEIHETDGCAKDCDLLRGQIIEYIPDEGGESGMCRVAALGTGDVVSVDACRLRPAGGLMRPGQGGDNDSFDIVIGHYTQRDVLGEEVSHCLSEKGFCVMKVIQGASDIDPMVQALKVCDATGQLARLAEEIEEGYLGRGGRAKTMWLKPDGQNPTSDRHLIRIDDDFTYIADVLQSLCEDTVGRAISDRTPALVCLSMNDNEEDNYERPDATNESLGAFWHTWARSVFRIVRFFGPAVGVAVLERHSESPIPGLEAEYRIATSSDTMLIVREDTYQYSFEEPRFGEAAWMQVFCLSPSQSILIEPESLASIPKDELAELAGSFGRRGPPPPQSDLVSVAAFHARSGGDMSDPHTEWIAYLAGVDAQLLMPATRFEYEPYYSADIDLPGKSYVKHFSVQEGIDMFDNKYFEISNMEATCMDPMCRQVLEVGASCLHHIGITKKESNKVSRHASIGVGNDKQEWTMLGMGFPNSVGTNNQLAIIANRFNYVFNLKGASYVMDTACSSSLIATHLGKRALTELRWDPLEFHIGAGTGLTLTCFSFVGSCASHMLSASGRCLTFNASADGYNRGDGTGAALLKAGDLGADTICFLRGSEGGQDGRSASMSAPNGPAQERCVWGAVREARMTPPESTVWECHGTGTALGDPIEVGAVRKVQISMKRDDPLQIATSKSNLGHLEGSAAIAAMCKCILVVTYGMCPSTGHLRTLNPHLEHAKFEAIFCSEMNPYRYQAGHCQVSSFGVGGTNGHAIFWGDAGPSDDKWDLAKVVARRVNSTPPSCVVVGADPATWEYSGVDPRDKPGTKYTTQIDRDPSTGVLAIRWEKQQVGTESPPESFCLSGSHNRWAVDETMERGDVPGQWFQTLMVSVDGCVEFRLLGDGEESKALGPESPRCAERLAPIRGPAMDSRNCWLVRAEPSSILRVELFAPDKGPWTVTWHKVD